MNENVSSNGFELDWDSEIDSTAGNYVLAEPGDYTFTVVGLEKGRSEGSAKMPACRQVKATLRLNLPDGNTCDVKYTMQLWSTLQWKISNFCIAIGMMKRGDVLKPNWNAMVGCTGRCNIGIRKYTNNGREYETNEVKKFYDYEGVPFTVSPQVPQAQPQPQYQQKQYQQPSYQQQSFAGGYTPGKF